LFVKIRDDFMPEDIEDPQPRTLAVKDDQFIQVRDDFMPEDIEDPHPRTLAEKDDQFVNIDESSSHKTRSSSRIPPPMSESAWAELSPSQMAERISLNGPKTEWEEEVSHMKRGTDKDTSFLIDRINSLDPNIDQDMASEFLNV